MKFGSGVLEQKAVAQAGVSWKSGH